MIVPWQCSILHSAHCGCFLTSQASLWEDMEVIAGISSILQIIDSVTKVTKRLNEVRQSYNNVALNTTLVASQLSTIRAALEALNEWRAIDRDSSGHSKQLDRDLGMSLSCCAILISVIDGKLDESGYVPGLKQKIRYLWLEDTLKEYISNLEGQVRALQLLLTIFQCRTETEKRQKIGNQESRIIIEQIRAETVSLALDNKDLQDAASVLSLDPSVTLDIDSILLKSPAYKRVYGDVRLRLPAVDSVGLIGNSEQATCPAPTPFLDETLQSPPLPPRPSQVDETVIAHSDIIFELSGETQVSVTTSRPNQKSEEKQDSLLQHGEKANEKVGGDENLTGVESLMANVSEDKPLSMQTEKVVATALPTAINNTEPASALEGFREQLKLAFADKGRSQDDERNLGLLNPLAVPLEADESHSVAVSRNKASPAKDHSKLHSEESGLDLSRRNSLQEESRRPGNLYECSIGPVPKDQSTRTSSPYSCVSCRNLSGTVNGSENDMLEAEIDDLVRSSSQPVAGSADVQREAADNSLMNTKTSDQSQQTPGSAGAENSNEFQFQPPMDVLLPIPKSTTVVHNTHDKDLTTSSNAPENELAKLEIEGLKRVEMSTSVAGLGQQRVQTSETRDAHGCETEEPCSGIQPSRLFATARPSASLSPPAGVFFASAESGNPKSERSTLSADRPSSAHDATSTISSSEAPENSTILTVQQSISSTTATSISTHSPRLDRDRNLFDLRGLQDELATARARGNSRAVQDTLQRSVEATRHRYMAEPPVEDNNTPKIFPSPRNGKVRSSIIRFPSLSGSTKGVELGDSAASGNMLLLQKILNERVNVEFRSDNFKTPLMRAAMNGHIECMKLLKQFGADELAVDAKGRTALHIAVAGNRLAVVKWLLEAYPLPKIDLLRHRPSLLLRAADVVKGVRPPKNLREVSDAEGSKPLHIAAELDKGGMVKTLVAAGVDIESKDNWGRTALHRAIISKRRDSFDTLLRNNAQIAAVDAKHVSSLHLAAEAGRVDMLETLLAKGAPRWDFDADGHQPIHSAVLGGNISAIEALVTERADLDKRTRSGETLLHLACLKKDMKVATYLLTKLVDVNPWAAPNPSMLQVLSQTRLKGSSMTPLHYACCTHDFEMAVLLLSHNAWVNAPTPEGATALMMAVETEDTNLVNLLLEGGAKVNATIPGSLITALHLAARRGDLETVQQLCRQGADVSAQTSSLSYPKCPMDECLKCPDKTKSHAVEIYIRTVVNNKRIKTLQANARNLASRTASSQASNNPSRAQASPLADPVSHGSWARTPQGYVTQQARAQNPQYYHSYFDVPDETLPAYEPGPSAPARLANQAPVHRENYA